MVVRLACSIALLAGCTAIRPLDPIDRDVARVDASFTADVGIDAGASDAGMDGGNDAAEMDAWRPDAWMGDANCHAEVCGGGDEDCDGMLDESGAIDAMTFYMDGDGDGYGADASLVTACTSPVVGRWVPRGGDCNDTSANVHPGRSEITCNGMDDECDGTIDDTSSSCGVLCQVRHDRGHAYLFCGQQRSQTEAANQCMALGYHLVDIDDMAENDFVGMNTISGGGGASVWIGLEQMGVGSFVSSTGAPATYFAWDLGEPNGSGPCVRMRTTNGTWSDNACGQSFAYVCEAP